MNDPTAHPSAAPLQAMTGDDASPDGYTLLVPSCDAYCDTWPYFFHFLFKYWPSVTPNIFLVSNHLQYADERVTTVRVGDDHQWGDNLRRALPDIPGEVLLLLLDDFFLNAPVDDEAFRLAVRRMRSLQGRYVGLDRFTKDGLPVEGTTWQQTSAERPVVGLNATLWRAAHLAAVVEPPGMNIWQAEDRLKALAREDPAGHYYIGPQGKPLVTYQESIKGLFWKPSTLQFFREQQVPLSLSPRPCPPQGQNFFAKLVRSFMKRRYRSWLDRRSAEIAAQGGGRVQPLSIDHHA